VEDKEGDGGYVRSVGTTGLMRNRCRSQRLGFSIGHNTACFDFATNLGGKPQSAALLSHRSHLLFHVALPNRSAICI
jgi:hypothetical protein